MKKNFVLLVALACVMSAKAQSQSDSLRLEQLQEVVVKGVRVQKNAPFAVANIQKQELQLFSKSSQELPFLFARTPGILAWSENGVGTGTTHLRIRGAADSRINITLDGVSLNSPEDQCVFWANMNSYASLLGSAQIQRGVGSSTNGDGAFGGTVSLATSTPASLPGIELTGSYGSYNTYNIGTTFSTGLLWKHFIFNGAYHETSTDGYLHGTQGRSGSYYGGLTYLGNNYTLSYKNIGNFEKTGQAWNGVVAGNDDASLMDEGIRTYKDMYNHGLGRFNNLYEGLVFDDNAWAFTKDANGNYLTKRYQLQDGSYWKKATDNFYQNHNILSAAFQPNIHWSHNVAIHYTYGYGYYTEFRPNNKFAKFGLVAKDAQGNKIKRSDFIRKKGLTQHTYGLVYNANYKDDNWDVISGLNLQQFRGGHFGYLTYVKNVGQTEDFTGLQYYDSKARKNDYSAFAKATYHLSQIWDIFADIQYRHVEYKTTGKNDKFVAQTDGTYQNQELDIHKDYNFVNPKAGISYHQDGHKAYFSVAYASREPERNNFTDNYNYPAPNAEHLLDFELGYNYTAKNWYAGLNLYAMDYKDQFVQTGQLSEIGENLTTNIDKSYRLGAELSAGWSPLSWMTIEGNAALSDNKIKDFTEYIDNWDDSKNPVQVKYDHSTLAFSPSAILNGFLNLHYKGLQAIWHTNYVSRQYLDNTENKERALPCYSQTDLHLNYTLKKFLGLKEVAFGLNLNNIFDRHYASSGWVYSAVSKSSGYTTDKRYYQIGFVPMAGFTMMGNITLRF
ncbi:MAG: TonB-dependent receptor plug domain-containing protein [Prevotella sp.]|jgi:iron complex outermembrane receptor protein|nr:TonB-dependent receptor plug domain-containing protein [Prevotella sp.]MCI1281967.1 TonB-dependent receptor plug domain-containing protein [Prevotella sp.]